MSDKNSVMNWRLFQTTCMLSEADKPNDVLSRKEGKKKSSWNCKKKLSAQTKIIGAKYLEEVHIHPTETQQCLDNPKPSQLLLKIKLPCL